METTSRLTELILTVQNDVQSSVDFAETNLRPVDPEDTTRAGVFMSVGSVDVKLPLLINLEENIETINDAQQQINQITDRQGLLIQDLGDGTGLFTKIAVNNPSEMNQTPELIGEIQINFTPTERQ